MRKFLSVALISAIGLSLATGAHAQRGYYGGYGPGYGYGYREHHSNIGTALVAGVAGLAVGAALASRDQQPVYGYYAGPPAVVYDQSMPYNNGMQVWCHQVYNPFQGPHAECNTFFNGQMPPTPGWWHQ